MMVNVEISDIQNGALPIKFNYEEKNDSELLQRKKLHLITAHKIWVAFAMLMRDFIPVIDSQQTMQQMF